MLPENKKVNRDITQALKIWVYGKPNIGKTTFANQFPDTLMLNTDGNIKGVDSPCVSVGGENPWEDFVATVDEILKGNHTFKTIVVDLTEDIYQYCRNYYCKKLKIDHEADLGYGKGYDIIKNAFLIVLRKLCNTEYNVILCSHEKEVVIKDRIGRETTVFKPNIGDTIATKISGMVEMTARSSSESVTDAEGQQYDERRLFFGAASDIYTGNKIKSLKDDYIVMSETEGYNTLIGAIKSELPKVEVKKEVKQENKKQEATTDDMLVVRKKEN